MDIRLIDVNSYPIEERTKICQLKDLILALICLICRRIFVDIVEAGFEDSWEVLADSLSHMQVESQQRVVERIDYVLEYWLSVDTIDKYNLFWWREKEREKEYSLKLCDLMLHVLMILYVKRDPLCMYWNICV